LSVRQSLHTIYALVDIVTEFETEFGDNRCVLSVFRCTRENGAGCGTTNDPTASVESTIIIAIELLARSILHTTVHPMDTPE
jgi:hypothetical protein